MVLFAGPIFTDWYWIPILVAAVVLPSAIIVGAVSELLLRVRRRSGPVTWDGRLRMWGIVAVGWVLLAAVGTGSSKLGEDGEARATARAFDFTPHEPRLLPAGFAVQAVTGTRNPPRLERHYLSGSSAVTAYEQRPVGRVVAEDGTCAITQLGPDPFPCREWRSPTGRSVFFYASASRYPRRSAFALLEGSLVRLDFEALPETDVLAYFDSLEPVDRDSVEFTRG